MIQALGPMLSGRHDDLKPGSSSHRQGGCGLDLAMPTRPLASKRSTPRSADGVGNILSRKKLLPAEPRLENEGMVIVRSNKGMR